MKRLLFTSAALAALALGGCGESSPPAQQKSATSPPVEKAPEIAKPTEPAPAPPPPPAPGADAAKKDEKK
jgi:hypothetical protein